MSEQAQAQQASTQNVTSLKTVILISKDYFFALVRKWYIYLIVCGALLFITRHQAKKEATQYVAKASFMTNSQSSGGMSGVMQIMGQFGIGGGRGGQLDNEKLVELLASRKMIFITLAKEATINDKKDFLFNHYINLFNIHDEWEEDEELQNFKFEHNDYGKFTTTENKAAQIIYITIKNQLLNGSVSKGGVIKVNCISISEAFSQVFLSKLIETLDKFYIDKAVEQQNKTYKIIKNRVDSLQGALFYKEEQLASWIDENRTRLIAGTLSAKKRMKQERMKGQAEILSVMYAEAVKNRELAYMNLLSHTPIIQIIDSPVLPLEILATNRMMRYITSVFAGGVMVTVLIIFIKLIRDALREEEVTIETA